VAKPSAVTFLHCSLAHEQNLCILPKASLGLLYIWLSTDIYELLLTIRPWYISNCNTWSKYIQKPVKHWCIRSYIVSIPLFLLVSIALTFINTFSTCLFDFCVGRINPWTFGAALTSRCSGHSWSSMLLSCSISDSMSTAQFSSLSFGLSKSPFQLSQSSVSEMLSGALSWSLSTGWLLILRIWRTFNIWVGLSGQSYIDNGGGAKQDLSNDLNAAAPSCWKSDQDAFTITSMSEMHPTLVICLFWARCSFWVAPRFWLPCNISKMSWTLAILGHVLSSASFFISESFSLFVASSNGSVPATITLLARANCLTRTVPRRVSALVFDCLQPITYRPREKLASILTPCGMIENMSCASLERSAYLGCVSSCRCRC